MAQTAGGTYYAASSELVSSWPATSLDLANQLESRFAAKAPLASPALTGTPTAPTAAAGTNTTQIATTAFVQANSGLAFINSTYFTGSSTINVNNVFSSTYFSYRLVLDIRSASAQANIYIRMRVGGADNTTSNYYFTANRANPNDGTLGNHANANPTNYGWIGYVNSNTSLGSSVCDVVCPYVTVPTSIHGQGFYTGYSYWFGNYHAVSTAFDGFSIFTGGAPTITGSVHVYGYRL